MQAREVMTTTVVSVTPETTVPELARLLMSTASAPHRSSTQTSV